MQLLLINCFSANLLKTQLKIKTLNEIVEEKNFLKKNNCENTNKKSLDFKSIQFISIIFFFKFSKSSAHQENMHYPFALFLK